MRAVGLKVSLLHLRGGTDSVAAVAKRLSSRAVVLTSEALPGADFDMPDSDEGSAWRTFRCTLISLEGT